MTNLKTLIHCFWGISPLSLCFDSISMLEENSILLLQEISDLKNKKKNDKIKKKLKKIKKIKKIKQKIINIIK